MAASSRATLASAAPTLGGVSSHRAAARVFHDTLGGVGRARGLRIAPARRGAHRRRPGRERGEARRAHPRAWRRDEAAPSLTRASGSHCLRFEAVASRADAEPRTEECECRSHVGGDEKAAREPSACGVRPGTLWVQFVSSPAIYYGSVRNLCSGRSACGASGRDVGRPRAQVVGQRSAPWAAGVRGGELGVVRRRSRYVPTRTALPPSPRNRPSLVPRRVSLT